jgi:hypothetical protein
MLGGGASHNLRDAFYRATHPVTHLPEHCPPGCLDSAGTPRATKSPRWLRSTARPGRPQRPQRDCRRYRTSQRPSYSLTPSTNFCFRAQINLSSIPARAPLIPVKDATDFGSSKGRRETWFSDILANGRAEWPAWSGGETVLESGRRAESSS